MVPVTPADVASALNNLRDPDANVRRAAVAALAQPETIPAAAIPVLIEVSQKDSVLQTRLDALAVLGKAGLAAVPALTAALGDHEAAIVFSAARALQRIGPDAQPAIPALIRLCKNQNEELRQGAGLALRHIGARGSPRGP